MAANYNKTKPPGSQNTEHSTAKIIAPTSDTDVYKFRTVVGLVTPNKLQSGKDIEKHKKHKSAKDSNQGDQHRDGDPSNEGLQHRNTDMSNECLYSRVCERENTRRLQYILCVCVLDAGYMLQIAFAAILTAMVHLGHPSS